MSALARAFVVVSLILGIGCAQNKDGGDSVSYCSLNPVAPDCTVVNPPVPGGSNLTLPTAPVVPQNETDPLTPFPARIQIISLSPSPGTMVTAPFNFVWSFKASMDTMKNQYEAVNFEFYPSDDGVNPSGERFANGGVRSGMESVITNGNGGGFFRMNTTFKTILVKADWLKSGVGHQKSTVVFENVNLGKR